MDIRLNLEFDKKEFEEKLHKDFVKKWQEQCNAQLNILFADPTRQNRYSDHEKKDVNFGLMTLRAREIVDQYLKEFDLNEKVKSFLERNFDKYFEDAMDEALRHQTRKLAFSQIKEQAPREHKE